MTGAAAARTVCESGRSAGYHAVLPSVLGVLLLALARMLTAAPPPSVCSTLSAFVVVSLAVGDRVV